MSLGGASMKKIVLAGGCFWGVEAYLEKLAGIIFTKVGYANGQTENPSYEQICSGITGHTEAVWIEYDEEILSLKTLLQSFWHIINPTLLNRQGPDIGNQYRTGIYYLDANDLPILEASRAHEQEKIDRPIVTEIEALKVFYDAGEYHQKYLQKNPNGYCHIDLSK
jgi:peptide-methionine (S)-S-oxide reductase